MSKPSMCLILFSSNRLEYLVPTLNSLENLDFSGVELKKLFVDDYPLGRDDRELINLVSSHGFDFAVLHEENRGITGTWTEVWELLRGDGFDYIFMHEDDATHTVKVDVADIVELLEQEDDLSQVQFGRDPWYGHESYPDPRKHQEFKQYKWEADTQYFWMMSSICRGCILNYPIKAEMGYDLSESVVAHYLAKRGKRSAILRDENLNSLIDHIGDYSQGVRISKENDPGWENLGMYRPGYKYCSKTGKIIDGDI